jgi:hypothetical protein
MNATSRHIACASTAAACNEVAQRRRHRHLWLQDGEPGDVACNERGGRRWANVQNGNTDEWTST